MFHIHNNNMKILRCTSREVEKFKTIKEQFDAQWRNFGERDLVDLFFEFQVGNTKQYYTYVVQYTIKFISCRLGWIARSPPPRSGCPTR